MPKRTDFTEWAEDQLAPLGQIRIKSMFRLGLEAAVRARAAKLPKKKKPGYAPG
jgi:hypothetical protein